MKALRSRKMRTTTEIGIGMLGLVLSVLGVLIAAPALGVPGVVFASISFGMLLATALA